jgi:hypothetical protein
MGLPLTSIIIATYQHAAYIREAIDSALAQTAPVEVIVVDDGSTDDTARIVTAAYGGRVRFLTIPHGGPSAARNAGLRLALGEFVMFLDGDDVIAPEKVERQLAAFDPAIGWVLCDTRIEDEDRRETVLASERYRYADKEITGWIAPLLKAANFIPVHAVLVRRSVLDDVIWSTDAVVMEDWFVWRQVAHVARVAYIPDVLCTYRKRHGGRGRSRPPGTPADTVDPPFRLNLGCGNPENSSWHPLPGLLNLDKRLGWRFEEGLPFEPHSVAGITVSHAMMFPALQDWPFIFSEFARVLVPGGVVRITEDQTDHPDSQTYPHGWRGSEPAVTLTTRALVREHLERAGLVAVDVTPDESTFPDTSLCQSWHGEPPHVFYIEGVKEPVALFAPHNDDEALFAAYTVQRERPRVVVCFPSYGDYGDAGVRELESRAAVRELGAGPVEQWQGGDLEAQMRALDELRRPRRSGGAGSSASTRRPSARSSRHARGTTTPRSSPCPASSGTVRTRAGPTSTRRRHAWSTSRTRCDRRASGWARRRRAVSRSSPDGEPSTGRQGAPNEHPAAQGRSLRFRHHRASAGVGPRRAVSEGAGGARRQCQRHDPCPSDRRRHARGVI